MVGVDEVGRGCLAGPLLVVAARPKTDLPQGLKDSKLLSRQQREALYPLLLECADFGEGWIKPGEIDRLGLANCLKLGVRRALKALLVAVDEEILMDGIVNYVPKVYKNGRCQIDADANVPVVSAASIYAKVTRDRFMTNLAKRHPKFSFASHVGYGTPEHYAEIGAHGPLKTIHRLSFAPFNMM